MAQSGRGGEQGSQAPVTPTNVAYFDAFADGAALHVLVGYGSKSNPAVALWHRRSDDGGKTWSDAVRINGPDDGVAGHHPGENPQVAARGDRVVAIWTQPNPDGGRGGGPIASAVSKDGGKAWTRGVNPAGDDDTSYHALIDLAAGEGGFHAVWLQHAKRPAATPGAAPPAQPAERPLPALRHVASKDGVAWLAQSEVAPGTCYCCWNRMVVGKGNEVGVLYRGGVPRDMFYVRHDGKQWQQPVAVGAWGWEFAGCPHVGGALTRAGKDVHALVWSGMDGKVGLYHAASHDDGATWSDPARLGGESARHADLAAGGGKQLTAVWDAPGADGQGSVVWRAQSRDGGKTWGEAGSVSGASEIAMHPRVFATASGEVTLWLSRGATETTLRVNGRDLPAPAAATKDVAMR